MKKELFLLLLCFTIILTACNTGKKAGTNTDAIYGPTWELEYLSGPKIAFDALFPEKKPQISFDKSTKVVQGNDGCNGYIADFTQDGPLISFGEPGPSTMMYCGDGEAHFRNIIKGVTGYNIDDDGKLNLMLDNITVMRFKQVD